MVSTVTRHLLTGVNGVLGDFLGLFLAKRGQGRGQDIGRFQPSGLTHLLRRILVDENIGQHHGPEPQSIIK